MRTRRTSGFTLVELLVVIAVFMTLTGLLVPVFSGARVQSRKSACLSNLRQIGLAALMYAADYDATFPWLMMDRRCNDEATGLSNAYMPAGPFVNLQGRRGLFMEYAFRPYTKDYGIYRCLAAGSILARFDRDNLPLEQFGSYAYAFGGEGAGPMYASPRFTKGKIPLEMFCRYAASGLLPLGSPYNSGNPQDYFIAGQSIAKVGSPSTAVIAFCNSYGMHVAVTDEDVTPTAYGGNGRGATGVALAVSADGHAKRKAGKFIDLVKTIMTPLRP
jgi:prepilin-type N-terminal cleavage/methylation domain-containing protein